MYCIVFGRGCQEIYDYSKINLSAAQKYTRNGVYAGISFKY